MYNLLLETIIIVPNIIITPRYIGYDPKINQFLSIDQIELRIFHYLHD